MVGKLETISPFRSLRYYFKRYFKGTVKDESGIAFILTCLDFKSLDFERSGRHSWSMCPQHRSRMDSVITVNSIFISHTCSS